MAKTIWIPIHVEICITFECAGRIWIVLKVMIEITNFNWHSFKVSGIWNARGTYTDLCNHHSLPEGIKSTQYLNSITNDLDVLQIHKEKVFENQIG